MSDLHRFSMTTKSFYGNKSETKVHFLPVPYKTNKRYKKGKIIEKYPFKYLSPETPSSSWKVFTKQKDALEAAKQRMNGVMTFVYQSGTSGERHFLVAHPRVFWYYDCRRDGQRCSYEIIPEHNTCKLYFDLEFCKESNPHHDGIRMTETFIKVISFFLQREWNIVCTRQNILDLDSSTDKKFSRHLIYQLPGFIFEDNYHVGNFVRTVCNNLRSIKNQDKISLVNVGEMGVSINEFIELFVHSKERELLFCDESVYSKNRHFRLYCSTKWNRRAHLVRSKENKWLCDCLPDEEMIFLSSLITYIPTGTHLTVLQCSDLPYVPVKVTSTNCGKGFQQYEDECLSPYPDIDRFIQRLVAPGRIYRSYYSSQSFLHYDIVGNRYCQNIGREHKSNNIKFIVDVNKMTFHQKCYDPDCKGFSSELMPLPSELMFVIEGPILFENVENKESLWENNFVEEELSEVLDCIESAIVSRKNVD